MKKLFAILSVALLLLTALPLTALAAEETVAEGHCHCELVAPTTKYCPDCGKMSANYEDTRYCETCGKVIPNTTYCPDCGNTAEGAAAKTNFGFNIGSLKETLPIMGMGMLGIFLVIGLIVLVVVVLSAISKKAGKKEE